MDLYPFGRSIRLSRSALRAAVGGGLLLVLSACEAPRLVQAGDAGADPAADAAPWDDAALSRRDAGADAGTPSPGLAVYPVRPVAILDTRATSGPCGAHPALDAAHTVIEVSLDACADLALPEATAAFAATLTIVPRDPSEVVELRIGAPEGLSSRPITRAGPNDPGTTGVLSALGADRTLRIERVAGGAADVIVELTAVLAPPGPGARGVEILPRPVRLYTARWDEAGIWHGPTRAGVDERLSLNEVAEDPLGALPEDVVGVLGVAHVGPDGLCEPGATVALGPARPEGDTTGLARIATCAPETTFPHRSSTAFMIGASGSQQLALRAEVADANVHLDVVGYLVPYREGAALYHRHAPRGATIELSTAPQQVESGIAGALALSGWISGASSSRGGVAVGAEPSSDAPSGPFTTLELPRGGTASAWLTTRADAAGAFVVESEVDARLELAIDAYWAP